MRDRLNVRESLNAHVIRGAGIIDELEARGVYTFECFDAEGNLRWKDTIHNTVMTEGKDFMLDAALSGSAYTVTGPYMGLISNVSFTAIAVGDTAAQINGTNGWKEAGGANTPGYSGNRKTCVWDVAAAGAKALTAALQFTFSSGTNVIVKGAFILYGTGALNTKDDTNGVLWSAGTFAGGDKTVSSSDILNVSYGTSM